MVNRFLFNFLLVDRGEKRRDGMEREIKVVWIFVISMFLFRKDYLLLRSLGSNILVVRIYLLIIIVGFLEVIIFEGRCFFICVFSIY